MNPQAHLQLQTPLLHQVRIELPHGLYHSQPGPHRPLGVIFMRQRVPELDEQAIAKILGDMPLEAGDHLGAGLLVGPHHLAPLFQVEPAGEGGRVHQIAKEHRELVALRVGETRFGWCGILPEG